MGWGAGGTRMYVDPGTVEVEMRDGVSPKRSARYGKNVSIMTDRAARKSMALKLPRHKRVSICVRLCNNEHEDVLVTIQRHPNSSNLFNQLLYYIKFISQQCYFVAFILVDRFSGLYDPDLNY